MNFDDLLSNAFKSMNGESCGLLYSDCIDKFVYNKFSIKQTAGEDYDFDEFVYAIDKQNLFRRYFKSVVSDRKYPIEFASEFVSDKKLHSLMQDWIKVLESHRILEDVNNSDVSTNLESYKGEVQTIRGNLWYELTLTKSTYKIVWESGGLEYESYIKPYLLSYNLYEESFVYEGVMFYDNSDSTGCPVFVNPLINGFINSLNFDYGLIGTSYGDGHERVSLTGIDNIPNVLLDLFEKSQVSVIHDLKDLINIGCGYRDGGSVYHCVSLDGSMFLVYLPSTINDKDAQFILDFIMFSGYITIQIIISNKC